MGTSRKGINRTHGHRKTGSGKPSRTYSTWASMWTRCTNEKSAKWHRYGGRGIAVCDRWASFEAFLADMGERPAGMTLDREDSNRGYYKENCRWATTETQARNRDGYIDLSVREQIRRLYATGSYKQKDLAVLFSTDQTTVSRIVRKVSG